MATNTLIVNNIEYPAPFHVENWNVGDTLHYRFVNEKRTILPVTELIIHETVTTSALSTVKVLQPPHLSPGGRGLGVHFIVGPDGVVTQHGDLALDTLWHASQHNPYSVGIEAVNPFMPNARPRTNNPWQLVIDAPWAVGGRYVVPTKETAEAVCAITKWLIQDCPAPELAVPFNFVGFSSGTLRMSAFPSAKNPGPGVYAHHNFGHGDGSWLVLYTWLRLRMDLAPEDAYNEAVRRATGASPVKGIDVTDLLGLTM